MKELSIEDKVRRYDEAIEKIQKYVKDDYGCTRLRPEDIFPELKESEGDKICKWLIALIKSNEYGSISEVGEMPCPKLNVLAWLEKQGEKGIKGNERKTPFLGQKPADKVEPKFKIGDWVIDKQGIVHQIANVIENVTYHIYGYDIVGGGYFNDNTEGVRLWTIQDAKDGDVLASEDKVFLYSGKLDLSDRVCAYCGIYKAYDKLHFTKCAIGNYFTYKKTYPATKEQSNLLFRKMHEAGYEWDAEKKELKKIEQKQVIDYPDSLPKDNWELVHEFVSKFGRVPKDEDELNALVEYILKRQKLWSEEDERNLDWLITVCERIHYKSDPQVAPESALILRDWLKSLKDRHTWKPSERQKEALLWCVVHLGGADKQTLGELLEALNKL